VAFKRRNLVYGTNPCTVTRSLDSAAGVVSIHKAFVVPVGLLIQRLVKPFAVGVVPKLQSLADVFVNPAPQVLELLFLVRLFL